MQKSFGHSCELGRSADAPSWSLVRCFGHPSSQFYFAVGFHYWVQDFDFGGILTCPAKWLLAELKSVQLFACFHFLWLSQFVETRPVDQSWKDLNCFVYRRHQTLCTNLITLWDIQVIKISFSALQPEGLPIAGFCFFEGPAMRQVLLCQLHSSSMNE